MESERKVFTESPLENDPGEMGRQAGNPPHHSSIVSRGGSNRRSGLGVALFIDPPQDVLAGLRVRGGEQRSAQLTLTPHLLL